MAYNINTILTIAIPTYNRKDELEKCINSIVPQLNDKIKIVVRDNCSDYDAEALVRRFNNPQIEFYKNPVNVGGDANIARLFECCDTDWLWVLGDDDFILPDAVKKVIDCIEANPDVIYIKFNSPYVGSTIGISGFLNAMKPRSAFANSFFTSECIYRINGCQNDIYYQYKYLSTMCGQIARVICHLIEKNDRCLFVPELLLEEHGSEISWTRLDLVLAQGLLLDFMYEFKDCFKSNIFKDYARYSLHYIEGAKAPLAQKIYVWRLLVSRLGMWFILKNNYPQLLRIPLVRILPANVYKKVRNLVMK